GKNSLNRLIRCVCGKKIGPDPRNFNQRVSLGRNDLLIRTFPKSQAIRVPPAKNGGALPARGRYYLFSSRAGTVYFRFCTIMQHAAH
ncbi:hypothetical protein, partial [Klebsiella quasipneumoniae]|uniref:hypothetical protein n=1 Tax=Klebsiella quasipneumoniae TaxID=1463165 RepID=UPI002169022A